MSAEHVYIAGMSALIVLLAVLLMYLASLTLLPQRAELVHFCYHNGNDICGYS